MEHSRGVEARDPPINVHLYHHKLYESTPFSLDSGPAGKGSLSTCLGQMCPYEMTYSIPDDVIRLSRNTCVQAFRRHGGTGIGLSPSQAAVAQCSRPYLEAEDVSAWCARRLRLFIFPPEHCTPACARLSGSLGRPSNGSRHASEGCLLMSAQLSSGEQSSMLAIA